MTYKNEDEYNNFKEWEAEQERLYNEYCKLHTDLISEYEAQLYDGEAIRAYIEAGECYIVQDKKLQVTYINGMKFSNELLIKLTHSLPIGELFIVLSRGDTITIRIIDSLEIIRAWQEYSRLTCTTTDGIDNLPPWIEYLKSKLAPDSVEQGKEG